jgi:hypothetical protein
VDIRGPLRSLGDVVVHPDGLTPREEPDSGYKCYLTPLPRETTSNLCQRFTDAVGQQRKTLEIDEFVRFPVANVLKAVQRGGQTIDAWDNKPLKIRDRTWKVNVNDGKHLSTCKPSSTLAFCEVSLQTH